MNRPQRIEAPRLPDPLRDAEARWDQAWAALNRRDYSEYDRLTGFTMPTGDDA